MAWITSIQDISDISQIMIGGIALIGIGGAATTFWIGAKLDRFKLDLFKELDEKYVTKEVCETIHKVKGE
jgi:hypothetical protein